MNKLSLELDGIVVDSFPTATAPAPRGTVNAAMVSGTGGNTCYCSSLNIGCWCTEAC
jgi:hypothetical protein